MNKIFGIILVIVALVMFVLGECLVIKENKYKVNFTNIKNDYTVEISKDEYVKKPDDPVKNGYNFLGWYYNDVKFNFNSKINKDITLVAKWSKFDENFDDEKDDTLSASLWNLLKNVFVTKK